MKVTELKKKGLAREFKIIISSKDVTDKLNGSLVQISKDVEIGRASCRERVQISVVAVSLKKKQKRKKKKKQSKTKQ